MAILMPPFAFEYNRIHHGLYVGSRPQPETLLQEHDFEVAVFVAFENQPAPDAYPGVEVLCSPLQEAGWSDEDEASADATAKTIAEHVRNRRNVLVSCMYGRNRSALVAALALHHLYGWSGLACMEWVRRMRKNTLNNHRMNDYLLSRPGTAAQGGVDARKPAPVGLEGE